MTARKTISLTTKDEQFIASQVAEGSFGNASEVVRAGLHLLEQRQLDLAALRQAIAEGEADYARGDVETYKKRGQLADSLKAKLLKRQQPERG